jgi:GNAT superfamily N-acetyltransferase
MSHSTLHSQIASAAEAFITGFFQMISIAQPVESRPFPAGVWQHFPNGRKKTDFSDEFYVLEGTSDAALNAIHAAQPGPRHYIDVIGPEPTRDDPAYVAAGYRCGWIEILMDRPLTAADAERPLDPRIVSTLSPEQIEALARAWTGGRVTNGYQPIVERHNTTPELVQAFIEIDGQPAAYGRAIVTDQTAFVSDVNTFPGFRRRGLGRAVMDALHAGAARGGATRVVLTATEMGLPLYEQLSYDTLAQVWIYASER